MLVKKIKTRLLFHDENQQVVVPRRQHHRFVTGVFDDAADAGQSQHVGRVTAPLYADVKTAQRSEIGDAWQILVKKDRRIQLGIRPGKIIEFIAFRISEDGIDHIMLAFCHFPLGIGPVLGCQFNLHTRLFFPERPLVNDNPAQLPLGVTKDKGWIIIVHHDPDCSGFSQNKLRKKQ